MRSSAVQCVKAAQRIENPVRPRNGTATVSVEAPHKTKVGHWEDFLRRLCEGLGYASQETCLNVCSTSSSLYGAGGSVLCAEISAAAIRLWIAAAFLFFLGGNES